jgi:2-amino-4-hydroxy-6-hydroxymethyldihydropteridine diphosphokinase
MLSRLFPGMIFTPPILTEPDDEKYTFLFRNVLAKVETELMPEEIIEKIKQTERAVGRSPRDKYLGKVIIDIDLIKYNDEILRPDDFQREYVQQLLLAFDETASPDVISTGDTTVMAPTEAIPTTETSQEEHAATDTPAEE